MPTILAYLLTDGTPLFFSWLRNPWATPVCVILLQLVFLLLQVQLDEFLQGVVWVPDEDADEALLSEGVASAERAADGDGARSSPEQAVAQCLFHLHRLANLWQPVLAPGVLF